MENLYFSLLVFFIVYFFNLIFVAKQYKNEEKAKKRREIELLKKLYSIDIDKIDLKKLLRQIALINTIIITVAFLLITLVEALYIKILLGGLLVIPFIFISYSLLGIYYKKKGLVKK